MLPLNKAFDLRSGSDHESARQSVELILVWVVFSSRFSLAYSSVIRTLTYGTLAALS